MQTVKTIPGKTYAVESAGEVIITNTETGAIAAQGDGSGQVLFTACANSYEVSDDTAKVVALFKLAPRLRLTLLQGVAGGLLPAGFTELEYLESSGTQFIDLLVQPNNETGIECVHQTTVARDILLAGTRNGDSRWLAAISRGGYATDGYGWNTWHPWGKDNSLEKARGALNLNNNRKAILEYSDGRVLEEDITEALPTHSINAYLFAYNFDGVANFNYIGKVFSVNITQGLENIRKLIPVLDNTGTPCMFDKVSRQCFYNVGSGSFGYRIKGAPATFALRDPHRVAPSGVYARRAGENELEVLADTEETTGDGWEWFANTGEAYEHFGITQDELLTE